ncbi:hypothetical protein [Pseudomonas putida]|uniref:hypothetical protein n=1 Tax=Pseudomonas putida TaxID=303 RepID=UPI000FD96D09|nr:hypothetical protein [Pseudomonas putida]MDD2023259.1 hypothetical protein [Pseudomonas putida]
MTRRSREEIVALIQVTMPWRAVSEQSLPPEAAETYRHRIDALEMYMDKRPIAEITHTTSIDGSYLKRLIKRCLTVSPDGYVYGYRACLPNTAI